MSRVRRPLAFLVASLLVLAAAACSDGDEDPDVAGTWLLVSGNHDGSEVPIVDGYRISLTLEDRTIGGTAACNLYGGDIEIDGESLSIGPLSVTQRGCEPAVMASEQSYLAALAAADTIARDGDEFVLSGLATELRFAELPPVPTAELLGTVWVLDTLIEGDSASTVSGEPATLELREDGTLVGSTGCRTLAGEYVVAGDEVVATSLAAEGECPPDLTGQDDHVITVIADGFTVAIDGDRLTLSSIGGEGAVYRAR